MKFRKISYNENIVEGIALITKFDYHYKFFKLIRNSPPKEYTISNRFEIWDSQNFSYLGMEELLKYKSWFARIFGV